MIEFGINGEDRVVLEQGDVYPGSYQVGPTFSDPTSDAGIRIKSIKGKSVQAVSTGKQLFDASRIQDVSRDGVTLKNLGNGRFQIEGVLTANDFNHAITMTHEESLALVKPGKIMSAQNGRTPYAYMTIYKNGVNTGREINTNNRNTCVITEEDLADPTFKISFGFYGRSASWNPADIYIPMFYQSGDGTWEPFTGGKPGPQPEYPIPIRSYLINKFASNVEPTTIMEASQKVYLRSLPDGTHDEYKDGKIIRRVGCVTLDGSADEQWTVSGMVNGYTRALFIAPGGEVLQLSLDKVMRCNRLPAAATIKPWNDPDSDCLCPVSSNTPGNTGLILKGEYTNAELRAWVQEHPLEVHYKLGEPVIEDVPELPILQSKSPMTNAWSDSSLGVEITWEALPAGSCALEVQELRKRIEALERKSVEDA